MFFVLVIHYIRIIRSCCTCPDRYLLNNRKRNGSQHWLAYHLNMSCHVYRHLPNTVKKEVHTGILVFLSILHEEYSRIPENQPIITASLLFLINSPRRCCNVTLGTFVRALFQMWQSSRAKCTSICLSF